MTWDPRKDGALCDFCPLQKERAGPPVPARWPANALALVVGEAPGGEEVEKGEPFVGRSGIELSNGLKAVGASRSQVALTNAIACRPPENRLDRILDRLRRTNVKREAAGKPRIPTPMECCRPRLVREIERLPKVVAVGKIALQTIVGGNAKIMDARGGPLTVGIGSTPVQLLPTLHPAFVMRSKRWRGAFRADLGRAFRWFSTGLDWREPQVLYRPPPDELRAFLEAISTAPYSCYDVETEPAFSEQEHFDPNHDRLRCIGIGTADGRAAVVPFRSVAGGPPLYSTEEQPAIARLIQEYLSSPRWPKVSWNGRVYDTPVIEHWLKVTPFPQLDALGLHRLAEPELPHGLGYSGSIHTDVDKWKQGHVATEARTDTELWRYNATDCVVTAMCVEPLSRVAKERGQLHLLPFFARLQDVCADLHRNGMYVNQAVRREWDRKLLRSADAQRRRIQELACLPNLNPSSYPQVGDLLFDELGIAPYSYTKMGLPSTEDDALRAFLSSRWNLDEHTKAIIAALRAFRKTVKRRGVVVRLRPIIESHYEGEDLALFEETDEEREERERRAKKGKSTRAPGLVLPDGRVHADWNAAGTVGWRFSSSNPNCQNLEMKLRDIFESGPGNVLVACDEAQLELRLVAGLAQCAYYLDRFASGADPHHELCLDTFGRPYERAEPAGKKKLRRCVKELTYSSLYWAGNETKHEVVTSAEDEKTEELLFPDFTLREVAAFTDNWHRRCPEIERWWNSIVEEWKTNGYLAEPIMGLKCDFLDGMDEHTKNKLVNYKPQAGGAALAHKALLRALDERPHLRRAVVQQGHDSVVFEVPAAQGEELGNFLERCMHVDRDAYGLGVAFEGEMKVGRSWKDV